MSASVSALISGLRVSAERPSHMESLPPDESFTAEATCCWETLFATMCRSSCCTSASCSAVGAAVGSTVSRSAEVSAATFPEAGTNGCTVAATVASKSLCVSLAYAFLDATQLATLAARHLVGALSSSFLTGSSLSATGAIVSGWDLGLYPFVRASEGMVSIKGVAW